MYQSRIDGEFSGWDGDTLFRLENGQFWQQAQYAYHYHYAYRPAVSILKKNGNYWLQVEGVHSTIPVRPITVVESQIAHAFKGWHGDTIVQLINGQLWQQAKYLYRYQYAYRPSVVIFESSDGYKMKVEGLDEVACVKRIR